MTMIDFKTLYKEQAVPQLQKSLGLTNPLAVPRIEKVTVNVGVGKTLKDSKLLDSIIENLKKITGQYSIKTLSRKSIAGFKIRTGQVVGLKTTLRGSRMYDFLEKLVRVVLPRTRDFKGLPLSNFDGHGNLNIGVTEHVVFPETVEEHMEQPFGLEVSIQTNTNDDKKALALLKSLGFPFREE